MTEGFAAVPNWMYRDSGVSAYAILVYGALASHQGKGGIYPSRQKLAAEARCSPRKVTDALNELELLGAVQRVRRTNDGGRATNGYVLASGGQLGFGEVSQVSAPDAPTGEVSAPDDASKCTSEQIAPYIEEEPIKKKSASDWFDEFWVIYPRHMAKAAAAKKFATIARKVDPQLIVDGARRYAADPNLPEKTFIPYPATWLNQGRWEDEPMPAAAVAPGGYASSVPQGQEWLLR